MASPVIALQRKYRALWFAGFEISLRSDYQREPIRIHRQPDLVIPSHEGDAIATILPRQNIESRTGRWIDRLGALVFPRCARHHNTRVVLMEKSDRHECPRCRKELALD
jgi:hypothetical protein